MKASTWVTLAWTTFLGGAAAVAIGISWAVSPEHGLPGVITCIGGVVVFVGICFAAAADHQCDIERDNHKCGRP